MKEIPQGYRDATPTHESRFELVPFAEIQLTTERNYLVKEIIPREGKSRCEKRATGPRAKWMCAAQASCAVQK